MKCPKCGGMIISRLIQAIETTVYNENGEIIEREISDRNYMGFAPICETCGSIINQRGGEKNECV